METTWYYIKNGVRLLWETFRLITSGYNQLEGSVKLSSLTLIYTLFFGGYFLTEWIDKKMNEKVAINTIFFNGFDSNSQTTIGKAIFYGVIILWVIIACIIAAINFRPSPKLEIYDTHIEEDTGGGLLHFRFRVRNESRQTIEQCRVSILKTSPPIPHLPIPLHCSHLERPNSDKVDLHPREPRTFDVFKVDTNNQKTTWAGCKELDAVSQSYELTIAAFGKNIEPYIKLMQLTKTQNQFKLSQVTELSIFKTLKLVFVKWVSNIRKKKMKL